MPAFQLSPVDAPGDRNRDDDDQPKQISFHEAHKKPRQFPSGAFYHWAYAATLAGMTVSNSSAKLQTCPASFAAIAAAGWLWVRAAEPRQEARTAPLFEPLRRNAID